MGRLAAALPLHTAHDGSSRLDKRRQALVNQLVKESIMSVQGSCRTSCVQRMISQITVSAMPPQLSSCVFHVVQAVAHDSQPPQPRLIASGRPLIRRDVFPAVLPCQACKQDSNRRSERPRRQFSQGRKPVTPRGLVSHFSVAQANHVAQPRVTVLMHRTLAEKPAVILAQTPEVLSAALSESSGSGYMCERAGAQVSLVEDQQGCGEMICPRMLPSLPKSIICSHLMHTNLLIEPARSCRPKLLSVRAPICSHSCAQLTRESRKHPRSRIDNWLTSSVPMSRCTHQQSCRLATERSMSVSSRTSKPSCRSAVGFSVLKPLAACSASRGAVRPALVASEVRTAPQLARAELRDLLRQSMNEVSPAAGVSRRRSGISDISGALHQEASFVCKAIERANPTSSGSTSSPSMRRSPNLSVALETGNGVLETLRWLKRQNGNGKTEKNKRNAETVKP